MTDLHTDHAEAETQGPFESWAGRLIPLFVAVVAVGILIGSFLIEDGPDGSSTFGQSLADLPKGPLAGEPVADFSVPMFDGSTFSMAVHTTEDGRPLVINFWASWCVPCRAEMPELQAFSVDHPDIAVVGIAVEDSRELAQAFAEEVAVTYPVGLDETELAGASLPYFGLPSTWIIDDGIIIRQMLGQITASRLEDVLDQDLGAAPTDR